MVFGRMKQRRIEPIILPELDIEEEAPSCTFDDDADPSIERCWADATDVTTKNATVSAVITNRSDSNTDPLVLGVAGAALVCLVTMAMMVLREKKVNRAAPVPERHTLTGKGKVQPPGVEPASPPSVSADRVRELKLILERETKQKQTLSEQNNLLKNALEERKVIVDTFTMELQSRDEQLAIFEQEQAKVKNELYNQIKALQNELQVQEKLQRENLDNMDGQCADLAGKVEGLMKELAIREEQWESFEKEAKAREVGSVSKIESIKKEFAEKEQTQKAALTSKNKQCTDLTAKMEAMAQEKKAAENQLKSFGKQREKWNAASAEIKRILKEKQEEVVGLTTRMEMFMGELKSREVCLGSLEQQLLGKKELTATVLEDLQKVLQEQMADGELWNKKTTEIARLLEEREAESRELAGKLKDITAELKSAASNVEELEAKVLNRECVKTANKAKLAKALEDEQAQRVHWTIQHANILRLLQERQEECASLTARVEIFAGELESREKIVVNLEANLEDKKTLVASQLQSTDDDLKGAHAFRDTWSNSSKGIHTLLEEKKEQIVGLSTRVDLFHLELKKREDRVTRLEAVLQEKQGTTDAVLEPYRTKLKSHMEDLEQWANNTRGIKQLLEDRKGECVGLTTRLTLFKQKVAEFDTTVNEISKKVNDKEGVHSFKLSPLRRELQKQKAEKDKWNEQTIDIGNMLNDRQGQCVGLTTRVALFHRQTTFHQDQVSVLEAKVADLEEQFRHKIEPIQNELQIQQQGLEAWKKSTENVETMLEKAKQECVDLTTALKSNVAKLQRCQKEVAILQAQVIAKGDVAVSNEEQHLALRKVEEEELKMWLDKTNDLECLLKAKEGQIPGISTRVSLFNHELNSRQAALKELEAKFKEKGIAFERKISSLRDDLKFQAEQRDHCLEATLLMSKSMKEVKEPCVGLSTRLSLFRKELRGREERVRILSAQTKEKEELAFAQIKPIKCHVEKKRQELDDWNDSTNKIFQLLKSRKDVITGTTTRLELFMSELQKKEDAVDAAEARLKEIDREFALMDNLESEIRAQEGQRRKWQDSTAENARLLQLAQEQRSRRSDDSLDREIENLSAKLELFRGELQRREEKVKELKATSQYKGELLAAEKGALEKKIPALKNDRDSWLEKTMEINKIFKDAQAECVGLSTRWDLFKVELKKKRDTVDALEVRLKEMEEHHFRMVDPYRKELKVQTELVSKWVETTEKMDRLLKKKEGECVTFTTQLETAIDELSSRKEQVALLETRLSDTLDLAEMNMTGLARQLSDAREGLGKWKASTDNVEKLLKDTRQQCANLKVRIQVFHRQVETQNSRIESLQSAYQSKKDDVDAQLDALQEKLREQKMARDESVSSTLIINQQIKEKESQCTSISVRLSLFRAELENRELLVGSLEAKLADAEGMSAVMLDPAKAQLKQQKDELAKWAQNTKDVEQLLRKRDEERIGLSTRLQLFQLQLKTIEENVSVLQERIQHYEERAASEMAPFKNALQAQQHERERWTKSTSEIVNLLNDRKAQITGLTVRFSLFRKEVKHRHEIVLKLESQLREKEAELNATSVDPVKRDLAAVMHERAHWATLASNLVKMKEDKHKEVEGLKVRLHCFTMELQKREEACNVLFKKYENEKSLYGSQVQVLQSELAMQTEQRDKWRETTTEMRRQLRNSQEQCTGLTTRVKLFEKEIAGHNATITSLKLKVEENDAAIAEIEDLKKELKVQRENRDSLRKAMEETSQLLKVKKDECTGLATRLVVFRRQLQERMEKLNLTETKVMEKVELSNSQIESLKTDLLVQKEQRGKWSETTQELKALLEEKENQCAILSAELELLTALQTGTA